MNNSSNNELSIAFFESKEIKEEFSSIWLLLLLLLISLLVSLLSNFILIELFSNS